MTSKSTSDKKTDILKPLHSKEAEQSVIGGLILDNKAWDKISDLVYENDFYDAAHKIIFNCISKLANKNWPFDWVTLTEELKKINELSNIGGDSYLVELLKNTPTAANIRSYAEIVKNLSTRRQVISAAQEAINCAYDLNEDKFLDQFQKLSLSISENKTSEPKFETEYSDSALNKIMEDCHSEKNSVYMKTGFTELDELIGGFELNSYVIIAARPSMGKTLMAVNIAENIAKDDKSILIFSLETTAMNLQYRKLARNSIVKLNRLKEPKSLNPQEIDSVVAASNESKNLKIAIDDSEYLTTMDIRTKARRIKNKRGLDLIIIDYVQLIKATEGDNDISKLGYISRDLRALAKELNVCVLILSQLNRNIETRQDKTPLMSDLKQSGSLEQDASMIIFIDRPHRYDENSDPKLANIFVEKNKDGRTGKLKLTFEGEYSTFSNYRETGFTPPPSYKNICKNIDLN